MSTLATVTQQLWKFQPQQSEKKKKEKESRLEKNKQSCHCLQRTCYYTENPKDATRKLLEPINEFGKVAGYKINAQKSLSFLYTNDEKSEREIKETLPFTTATERIKYLGVNLPKETKDLSAENYKTLMKEIKDDTNRWRDIPWRDMGIYVYVQLIHFVIKQKLTHHCKAIILQESC